MIYPNPAADKLYIERVKSSSKANVLLYTVTGQLVRQVEMKGNKQLINTSNLSEGLYLLRITDERGILLKMDKVIIKSK